MKHLRTMNFVIATAILFMATSCELLEDVGLVIESDKQDFEFTISENEAGTYTYSEEDINSEIDSVVEANDYNIDQINEVTLKECAISIASPDSANFDAIKSFKLVISKTTMEEGTLIAQETSIADGLTSLTLTPEETDLTEFVKGDNYKLFVSGVQDEAVTTEIVVTGTVKYEIEVGF
ncbi:MAG: hypothetical protein GVY19_12595 [Bacteroidetes bacterium]|jgi:hypothetical protein|nr:hypothetical protein [Bacteroidota bacterium]